MNCRTMLRLQPRPLSPRTLTARGLRTVAVALLVSLAVPSCVQQKPPTFGPLCDASNDPDRDPGMGGLVAEEPRCLAVADD